MKQQLMKLGKLSVVVSFIMCVYVSTMRVSVWSREREREREREQMVIER